MGGEGVLKPLLGLLLLLTGVSGQEWCATITIDMEWEGGYIANFSSQTLIPFEGLDAIFTFDLPVDSVEYGQNGVEMIDDTHVRLTDIFFTETGEWKLARFQVDYSGDTQPAIIDVDMNGQEACDGLSWTTATPYTNPCEPTGMAPYDYSQALCMSFLFYEAERSGALPADQRVTPWRWDSALGDGADVGHDLTGGYYDAGDHVKFGFPMAVTATVLSWGLIDFSQGYEQAGQTEYGRAAVKWATDYFLKAHTAEYELYGQVGNGSLDHEFWGRPEDMLMERPAFKIDRENPGSELACETAAALAAASIVFQGVDNTYSAELLDVARELYAFGDEYRLEYQESISDAMDFYTSSGYGDELLWGALWLYRATGEASYLTKAQEAWGEFDLGHYAYSFDWDKKKAGAYALGSMLDPNNTQYEDALKEFLRFVQEDAPYTPEGLVFLDIWGSNRHSANVAFLALWAAKYGDQADAATNTAWATKQLNLLLGDTGHSFVVGFGVDPPQRPHHRSSSCPIPPDTCNDWGFDQEGPNPHVLYGALVGGPDENGVWEDDRGDYVHNEVACDYNAAYTGVLAAVIEINN